MDIEEAKKEFEKYVNNYDLKNEKIKGKYTHSYRVMEKSGEIAESLNLTKQEVEIAKIIGLLHDIGRFEQLKRFNIFEDHKSIDHGDLGVEILQKDNYLRRYIKEEKYDNIILKAIKNHNKFQIEEGLNEEELLFAKIIRDADKWDIFYEGVEIFWTKEEEIRAREKSKITPEVLKDFNNYQLINSKKVVTPLDGIIRFNALVYDINFKHTYQQIEKNDYINKVLNKFNIEDKETALQMKSVGNIVKEYIEKQI